MKYTFKINNPAQHFIQIVTEVVINNRPNVSLKLPSWRPGRYELGDFAKNIKDFIVKDEFGNVLSFQKVAKDEWLVNTNGVTTIVVSYLYYANELNAGSTFLDENQLYVNPINCCLFEKDNLEVQCNVFLDIPADYTVATSLNKIESKHYEAVDFHELVDSPFICSNSLKEHQYVSSGVVFYLCFQGEVKPDWELIVNDFKKFTDYQIGKFKSFPVKEYYFLFQVTPFAAYHGVEHHRSTVILLGPSYDVFKAKYSSLLGVSSHELYHTWNVKGIRPNDMLPYDYSKENYTQMGYVTEGVTTYMGDRILFEAQVFSLKQYFKELETLLSRHFHNDGRSHYSVAESSFDTWLDGYVAGVPGRKVSIYVEGALIALICDARIRKNTNNDFSLHDVIREIYSGNNEIVGYDRVVYQNLLEKISGTSFQDIFENLIYGHKDFGSYLNSAFEFYNWSYIQESSKHVMWNYGFKANWVNGSFNVLNVLEGSAAALSGIVNEDKIHSVNGFKLKNDLNNWLEYFLNEEIVISFERAGELKRLTLCVPNKNQYFNYKMQNN